VATNPIDRNQDTETLKSSEELDSRVAAGVSPEHRAVLEAALAQQPERSLYEVLASMPNVGEDSDFARHRG
jgi:hypothetical protein